jgi:hypothetical protein
VSRKILPIGETEDSTAICDSLSKLIAALVSMGASSDVFITPAAISIIEGLEHCIDGTKSAEEVCEKWLESSSAYRTEQAERYRQEAK